jgi:pilus assembly protein CpaF
VDAIAVVEDEVRELVRRRGLDPAQDVAAIRRLVDDVIADYDERTLSGAMPALVDRGTAARSVYDAVAGFGPLQPYLDDPEVEEIWVNDPGRVFIARRGRSELTTTILRATEIRDLVEKMLKTSGRRVDLSTPFVDATLPDGSRLHVVIPDITRQHWAVNTAHQFMYPCGICTLAPDR